MGNRKLLVIITIVVSVLLLFGSVAFWLYNKKFDAQLETETSPISTQVKINGKKAKNGVNRVASEDSPFEITFTREGFETVTKKVSVAKNEKIYVGVVMTTTDPLYTDWYLNNPEDSKRAEAISSKLFDSNQTAQQKNSAFIKFIPYISADFRIDTGTSKKQPTNPEVFAIYVTSQNEEARKKAMSWLRGQGVDTTTHEIIFRSYSAEGLH